MNNNQAEKNLNTEDNKKNGIVLPDINDESPQTVQEANGESQSRLESKKKLTESQEEGKKLSKDQELLVSMGSGVNLVPQRSEEEIKKEEKKFSFSVTSIVSLLLLITLSLAIVFYNIISRYQLNSAKEKLTSRETHMVQYTDLILSNEEILQRVDLYKYLERSIFSPKEIFEYIMVVVDRSGNVNIRNITLGNDLSFNMSGSTTDLSVVSRLWYLLGIDPNVENINLQSVGKREGDVSFSFEGQLRVSNFVGKKE